MDFREAVRVIWPGEVSGVVARAVNLSSTGILVDAPTPTPCPVGSNVLCDVTLPQGPRLLRGRVAHRRLESEKVGMGIEFIDLSPRESAELRGVIDDSDERPQRVKVRFEGTNQVVRARAQTTDRGFKLATALPFLKADTEVDIALSPDELVRARGWVSSVALDRSHPDGVPRLVIDVDVEPRDLSGEKTPVVELTDAVPERVWEPEDVGVRPEPVSLDASVSLEDANVPTMITVGPAPAALQPAFEPALAAAPAFEMDDRTEMIEVDPLERGRWRRGAIIGAGALALAVLALVAVRVPPAAPPVPPATPALVAAPPLPSATLAPAPAEPVAPVPAPAAAAAPSAPIIVETPPPPFFVGLTGSTAGGHRYPLRDPDGVAFNLPHARAKKKFGIFKSPAPGLRSFWVRPLEGGGTHLRFHFTDARPAPRVELGPDGVTVSAP